MALALVQSAKGTAATATVNPSFSVAPTSGNLIVLAFTSDDYNGTPNTGWTQSTGMEQQTFHGGYVWWRISTGANPPGSYTIGSATNSAWVMAEFSGNDAVPYDTSQGQFVQSNGNSYTTPAITPSTGQRLLVAMIGGANPSDMSGVYSAWLNSFTAIDSNGTNAGGTNDCCGIAYRVVTGDGSTTFSSGATFAHADQGSRSGLIISFKEAAAGGGTTLTAAAGAYTITGTAAVLARTHAAAGGSYALSGTAAAFAYKQTVGAGAYTLTGSDAGLNIGGNVSFTATAGAYTLTGSAAVFLAPVTLTAAVGAYTLTGTAATFLTGGNFTLFCDPGAYTLTGSAASFPGNEPLPPVVTTPPGGNYTGAGRGRMIRRREKRKEDRRDELEELLELVAQPAVQPDPKIPQIPQPSPPGLSALMERAELTPPQRKVVRRAVVSDDEDDDDEAIDLLLKLLS
jgi:hypothetical protein